MFYLGLRTCLIPGFLLVASIILNPNLYFLLLYRAVASHYFILYIIFYLNARDDTDDV